MLGKHCDKFVLRLDRHGFKRPSFIDSDKGFAAPDTRRHIAELRNKAVALRSREEHLLIGRTAEDTDNLGSRLKINKARERKPVAA